MNPKVGDRVRVRFGEFDVTGVLECVFLSPSSENLPQAVVVVDKRTVRIKSHPNRAEEWPTHVCIGYCWVEQAPADIESCSV